MTETIYLKKSTRGDKKFMVTVNDKKIHFGASGYSDYTKHKDPVTINFLSPRVDFFK